MAIVDNVAFGGTLVGKYWVRWLDLTKYAAPSECASAYRKMKATPGLIVVEVRKFDVMNGTPRLCVRVPGEKGYFAVDQFEWHGNYKG